MGQLAITILLVLLTIKACQQNGETFISKDGLFISEKTGKGYPIKNYDLDYTLTNDVDCKGAPSEVYSHKGLNIDRIIKITVCK